MLQSVRTVNMNSSKGGGFRRKIACNPIESFGIILTCEHEGKTYFLIYKRRDTYEYIEFIRGVWSSNTHVRKLFSLMTKEERDRIRNYTFDELWNDLWVEKEFRLYKDGKDKGRTKYNSIKPHIPNIIDTTFPSTKPCLWGFPKGKKNGHLETDIVCALREFEEETRIGKELLVVDEQDIIVEEFKGTNNKYYSSKYFVAEIPEMIMPSYQLTPDNIRKTTISDEAIDLMWCDADGLWRYLDEKKMDALYKCGKLLPSQRAC